MEHGRRRRTWEAGSGTDHISALPDELLHCILVRLYSAAAAARTCVLSRRWRRVWVDLPELVLSDDLVVHHGASFLDAVDGVLAAYSSATAHVHSLEITVPHGCQDVPALRVASWLRFASQRLAGELRLRVSVPDLTLRPRDERETWPPALHEGDELDLPPCERATSIVLKLGARFLLRLPQPAGTFAALSDLEMILATVEGRALEVLVSTQCPRLRKLSLWALTLVASSDVSLRSGTLRHLAFDVRNTLRLYVAAPALQVLDVESPADDVYASVHVAAPNLAEVVWGSECAHFVFADAGRHLRRLEVKRRGAMVPLMRRFNSVDELRLQLRLRPHSLIAEDGWETFLDDTNNNLPKCKTLRVISIGNDHAFAPAVLHLLRRGNGIRKLHVLYTTGLSEVCSSACPCRSPKSSLDDNIILDSLEEIEICLFLGSANEYVESLKQLLFNIWSNTKLTSVKTNMWHSDPSLISDVCDKIRATCPPNIRIKSYAVFLGASRARFETGPI